MNFKTDIEPFDSPLMEAKPLPISEARSYHVKTVLCYLDHPHYNYTQAFVEVPKGTLKVYSYECDGCIGHASVGIEGDKLVADLFIDYNTPERLAIESGQKLFAKAYGDIELFDNKIDVSDYPFRLVYFSDQYVGCISIKYVCISNKNIGLDERIDPIGKPIL